MRYLILIVLLVIMLAISGCSSPECQNNKDCDDGLSCTRDKCTTDNLCAHQNIPRCTCGDGVCNDQTENSCTCPEDCGTCDSSDGKYLKEYCIEISGKDECILGIPPDQQTPRSITDTIDSRKFTVLSTISYANPFDISRDVFEISYSLESIDDNVKEPRITKVQVYENLDKRGREINILGEKKVNKILWGPSSEVIVSVPLIKARPSKKGADKELNIKTYFDYKSHVRNKDKIMAYSSLKSLNDKITLVDPETKRHCPDSCDDQNKCTIDSCNQQTSFFCEHTPVSASCCGNNICDDNENTCTCPQDCGTCESIVGTYIEYSCVEQECKTRLRDPDVVEPKTLMNDHSWGKLKIITKTTFNEPFSVKEDVFTLVFELVNYAEGVSDIKIRRVQMLDDDELLGEKTLNLPLANIGDTQRVDLEMNFANNIIDEEEKNIKLRIFYDYTPPPKSNGDALPRLFNQVYTISYGKTIFINPEA